MDIRHLRYFLAITQEGSFSKAAQKLRVAQPALSLHVKNMEADLGVKLLNRRARGVEPTEAGVLLAKKAKRLLGDLSRAKEDVRSLGGQPSGTVRLGMPGTLSEVLAAPLIIRCQARFPKIKIVIADAMSGFVESWLHEGQVDIALLFSPPRAADLEITELLEEELVLLIGKGAPFGSGSVRKILETAPLIAPSGVHGLRVRLEQVFEQLNLSLNPMIEVDSYSTIKTLVREGYGVSVLPRRAVSQEVDPNALIVRSFPAEKLYRTAFLAHPENRQMTQACSVVVQEIWDTTSQLLAADGWPGTRPVGLRSILQLPTSCVAN